MPFSNFPFRVELEQLPGDLFHRLFYPAANALPGFTAHLVQDGRDAFNPHVFLDHSHAVHRQVKAVIVMVVDQEKIIGHIFMHERFQSQVASDAVLGVHDQVSFFEVLERQQLGWGSLYRVMAAAFALAEYLLGSQHGQLFFRPDKTLLQRPDAQMNPAVARISGHRHLVREMHRYLIVSQQSFHSFGLRLRPAHHHRGTITVQGTVDPIDHRLKQVVRVQAFFQLALQLKIIRYREWQA